MKFVLPQDIPAVETALLEDPAAEIYVDHAVVVSFF
jgi:hypothetical protein